MKYIQILPATREGATINIEEVFVTKKLTQCKTSCTLKIKVFRIPDNKNIGKLFSKYDCFSWIKQIPFLIHVKY